MSDDKPDSKVTVQLPKVDIASMITTLSADVKHMLSDVDVLLEDGRKTNMRLTRVEERIDDFDGRLMRNSSRVKEPSQHDLQVASQLAQEISAREALAKEMSEAKAELAKNSAIASETKVMLAKNNEMTTRMFEKGEVAAKKLWSNPWAKMVAIGIALFIRKWLHDHGIDVIP